MMLKKQRKMYFLLLYNKIEKVLAIGLFLSNITVKPRPLGLGYKVQVKKLKKVKKTLDRIKSC